MAYGRLTKVYDFGGGSVWDPQSNRRYAVSAERVSALSLVANDIVVFEPDADGRWATNLQRASIMDVPQAIRTAIDPASSNADLMMR